MSPIWKLIYPQIKMAVLNLDTVDALLRQVVEAIGNTYSADCLLWAGLERGATDSLRVYGAAEVVNRYAASLGFTQAPTPLSSEEGPYTGELLVQSFRPRSLPGWLLDQQHTPRLLQLETGELIIPVTHCSRYSKSDRERLASVTNPLQFVLQLQRSNSPSPAALTAQSPLPAAEASPPKDPIHGWSHAELESLDVVCSQLELAHSALYWRQRLEQSRQQTALLGRISRLLNSTLNPDEILGRIVAELGAGLQCDRAILIDLRDAPVHILSVWNPPEQELPPLDQRQVQRDYWQSLIDLFIQGAASYVQFGPQEVDPDPLQTWLQEIGVRSALLVPLFIQEEFFGAVALLSYQQERTYLLDELQTVRQVADQAAIALTNAQHYQRLWRKKEVLRMQNTSLQIEMLRDELTQLMNRRSLERELEQLSKATVWTVQPPFSAIVCDIDYFKLVNDAHGHRVGDEVLQELAQRLQGQLRRGTPAYRYGGEEFVVILTDTPLEQAVDVAERLRRTICKSPIATKTGPIDLTASFGVAQQDAAADRSAWDVVQRADEALYEAKRQGRDRVCALKPA